MMEFFGLSKELFGMEITDASVRLMRMTHHNQKMRVVCLGVAKIASGAIKGGEIKDEASVVAAIKEVIGKPLEGKMKGRHVVISLQEDKSFLQTIKMPRLGADDLRAAVVFEAENYIPLPLEKVYLDFEVINNQSLENSPSCEVLVTAFPRESIDLLIGVLNKAGLIPVAMELESQAVLRALSFGRSLESPLLIIQVGDTKTNIIIYADNSIRFTFSIPISSYYFTEVIAKSLNIDLDKANILRREYGIEGFSCMDDKLELDRAAENDRQRIIKRLKQEEDYNRQRIFEALVPGLVDFMQQIKKCVAYCQTHYSGRNFAQDGIGKILLCGSGSDLRGLDGFIAMKLGALVERVNLPIEKDILDIRNNNGDCQPCEFVVAFGLGLRATGNIEVKNLNRSLVSQNVSQIPKPSVIKKRLKIRH